MFARRPLIATRDAFTLLEICIVLALAVLLVSIAMPSLAGQMGRKRLQNTFDRFDTLVGEARQRSATERKPYVLVWKKGGVALYPADLNAEERRKAGPAALADFSGAGSGVCSIVRGASLSAKPAPEWTFWPTGNCEPVTVRYEGPEGTWETAYSGLSGVGTVNTFLVR